MGERGELERQWERFAPAWIERAETNADAARFGLLDDWMLDVVGDVAGLGAIDLGCGEGRFCRMLADRGARTLGVDLQSAFVDYATRRSGPSERYQVADMQHMDGIAAATFDLAVSYISLVDVPDQSAAISEAFRVLVPGGRFVVCNLSPMATAWKGDGPWYRDSDGSKLHYVLDHYSDEGVRTLLFPTGHELTNHHRMLSTTINDFLDAGFVLDRLHEPLPDPVQLARVPSNEDLFRVPIFTIYDLHKPSHS